MKSLFRTYGLPVICIPMGRDQNDNAAKIVFHGCGIKLTKETGPRKIRKTIVQILEKPFFQK